MIPGERSLNLATAVCAAIYEGLRQLAASGHIRVDTSGRFVGTGDPAAPTAV